MATDQGVGGSNPLAHVRTRKESELYSGSFLVVATRMTRTRGSVSASLRSAQNRSPPDFVRPLAHKESVTRTGFGLRSTPVGAEPKSTGLRAPSRAQGECVSNGVRSHAFICLKIRRSFFSLLFFHLFVKGFKTIRQHLIIAIGFIQLCCNRIRSG